MRWLAVWCGVAAVLLPVSFAGGGPLKGTYYLEAKVEAASSKNIVETFKGGQRACAIIIGDHEPVENLGLYVYDEHGNLVASDDGGGDACAVEWYPPQTGRYCIEVRNPASLWNKIRIAVR